MSLLIQLFGDAVINSNLEEVKKRIKALPPTRTERKAYLLKEFAEISHTILTKKDFRDVGA